MSTFTQSSWFQVGWSSDVKLGKIYPLSFSNQEFILFRSNDGIVHVWDAYCPHLGAHLGYGGKIVDDQLHCPFHGWQFATDTGQLTKVPFVSTKPRCQIKEYKITETNGVILLTYPKHDNPLLPNLKIENNYRIAAKVKNNARLSVSNIWQRITSINELNIQENITTKLWRWEEKITVFSAITPIRSNHFTVYHTIYTNNYSMISLKRIRDIIDIGNLKKHLVNIFHA